MQTDLALDCDSAPYGYELVLDLHACNSGKFNRADIDGYFTELCGLIDMEKAEVHFWDDVGVPEDEKQISAHTKGTSGSRGAAGSRAGSRGAAP